MSDLPKEHVSTKLGEKVELHPKIIDIKSFLKSTGHKPIFTRALIQNAADQLTKAKEGQTIELSDCYGKVHTFKSEVVSAKGPALIYNNYLTIADDKPWELLRLMPLNFQQETARGFGDDLDKMVRNSKLPIWINLEDVKKIDYDSDVVHRKVWMVEITKAWKNCSEREILFKSVSAMAHTAPITNIICIGNGPIDGFPASICQHIFAGTLAIELAKIYTEAGIKLNQPIQIYAQDPAYDSMDIEILSDMNIEVLDDPKAFLAVNSGSFVLSCAPSAPVKQVIADLATEDPSKCPAAVMWGNDWRDARLSVDLATYQMEAGEYVYYADAISKRSVDIIAGWKKIFDGKDQLVSWKTRKVEEDWTLGTDWLSQVQLWARPVGSSEA
jgi:hypothetical protein